MVRDETCQTIKPYTNALKTRPNIFSLDVRKTAKSVSTASSEGSKALKGGSCLANIAGTFARAFSFHKKDRNICKRGKADRERVQFTDVHWRRHKEAGPRRIFEIQHLTSGHGFQERTACHRSRCSRASPNIAVDLGLPNKHWINMLRENRGNGVAVQIGEGIPG